MNSRERRKRAAEQHNEARNNRLNGVPQQRAYFATNVPNPTPEQDAATLEAFRDKAAQKVVEHQRTADIVMVPGSRYGNRRASVIGMAAMLGLFPNR